MLKIGIIGTGGIAGTHLSYLKSRPDIAIEALCDARIEHAENRQAEFGGAVHTDFRQMLDQHKLDAVYLCTPPQVRRDPLLACADSGIPVFCEKPVECSAERAAEIARELAARNAKVQVGYLVRSMPIVQKLRELMADDSVHIAQSLYLCNISLQPETFAPWLYDKNISGGPIIEQGTHNLDLLRYLFGESDQVRGVSANPLRPKGKEYSVEEAVSIGFVFDKGTICSHTHSWVSGNFLSEFIISGEKRLYRLALTSGTLTWQAPGQEPESFDQGSRSIFEYENDLFLQQVKSGDWSNNICDYADGAATLALCIAADRACQ